MTVANLSSLDGAAVAGDSDGCNDAGSGASVALDSFTPGNAGAPLVEVVLVFIVGLGVCGKMEPSADT